ncbi:MAG: orotidine-5'-phosphate decarboxylase [Acidobacteria bacterium]|nr:orotidine-5'-phosphate decarboxylase [Acidobacteriota bacterium]
MKASLAVCNPIVVALDVETPDEALALVDRLRGSVGMFKIGKQLFTAAGPSIVRELIARGERVFLDLKFHDIPNTVAMAGVEAARLGVSIFNLHALGGSRMMQTTVSAVNEVCQREGLARPLILGVTILTSHTAESLTEVGLELPIPEQVVRLARLCASAGIDGVVASPLEISPIRAAVASPDFVIVTPGVRPSGAELNDQQRVMTPAAALRAGASLIVIGRPIIAAANPLAAAHAILAGIEAGIEGDGRFPALSPDIGHPL